MRKPAPSSLNSFIAASRLRGDIAQDALRRHQKVGVSTLARTANTTAQLVEFGKAEAVGTIDQDSVGAGNVQTVFDNGGGDEDVRFVANELEHHLFEFFFSQLAMPDNDSGFGNKFCDQIGQRIDRFHAIVDEVDLTFAGQFIFDGLFNDFFVERRDHGLNREAVAGRRFDDGHVAQANERHVQGARNRRGGKREGVNVFAHFLETFLVRHAEALLFVHDQQTQILELDVLREQAVRPNYDIDFASFQIGHDFLLFGRAAEAAEHLDARGKGREAFFEGFEMLKCQDRCRREDGDLLVFAYGFERGAHGHFGFAVAHVAAKEAVHGGGFFEVALDVKDGGKLIGSFFELEGVFELFLPSAVR